MVRPAVLKPLDSSNSNQGNRNKKADRLNKQNNPVRCGLTHPVFFFPDFYLAKAKFYILRKHLLLNTKYHLLVYLQTVQIYILLIIGIQAPLKTKSSQGSWVNTSQQLEINPPHSPKTICLLTYMLTSNTFYSEVDLLMLYMRT